MLKLIAIFTMILDHVGLVFFPEEDWFRVVGRLTMPIFAYAIARGFYYTGNRKRYLIQLLVLAAISQVPFMLMANQVLEPWWMLSMIVPWALAVLALMLPLWGVPLVVMIFLLVPMDYSSLIILLPVVIYHFWFLKKSPWLALLTAAGALSLVAALSGGWMQWYALLALPLIYLLEPVDGKVRLNKWFFYAFYPAHMLVIWLIGLALGYTTMPVI